MPSFCAVFNCSNRADREKNKSNYRFPSIVQNNGKKDLKLSKLRREKRHSSNFQERLIERKQKRTRMKIMLSASLYVKKVRARSYSGPYSVRMQENTDQNNFECEHFSRSAYFIGFFTQISQYQI